MPELMLHFSVIFALAAPRLGLKRALLVSFIALLPDLDVLLQVHRSMSHSIILLSLAYIPILLTVYRFKPDRSTLALLGLLALLSHPLMDCFQTYTPILYPLLDRSLWFRVDGGVHISPGGLTPTVTAGVEATPTIFKPFKAMDAPVFTSGGFILSLLLVAVPLILNVKACGYRRMFTSSPSGNYHAAGFNGAELASSGRGAAVDKGMVTVVLPTLNEENGVGKVIDELKGLGYHKILVVDGYSTDGTVEAAKSRGVDVVFQRGRGKAGAIRTAIDMVETPYMLVMDADGTYDPKYIGRMLNHISEYDEVIGFRVDRHNIPLLHRLGNHMISLFFSLLMGYRLSDPCSGMYMLRTERAKSLELTSSGFDVEAEIASQITSSGKIAEVPVGYRRRIGKRKLSTWRDGLRILLTAFKMCWLYNPVFLFSAFTALLAVPGAYILLWQLYIRWIYGSEAWSIGWTWLGLTLLVVGLQGLSIATISLLLKRMERRIINMQKRHTHEH